MNLKLLTLTFFSFSIALLSACSTNTDYLEATSLPPVKAPDDLDKGRLGQLYPVPEQDNQKPSKKFSVPLPPTVGIQEDTDLASIQTMAEESWVLNNKSAASTWAQLISFWQEKNVEVISRDLSTATMLTNWFNESVQSGYEVRYRLRLEQGLQPNTTDIFIENEKRKTVVEVLSDSELVAVKPSVPDPVHADLLFKQLVANLNKADSNVGDSFLAATIELPQKVRFSEFDGEPALLSVARPARLDRAFVNVLSKDSFVLYDQDKPQNVYYFSEKRTGTKRLAGILDFAADYLFEGSTASFGEQSLENILVSLPDEPEVNRLFPDVASRDTSKKLSANKGYLLVLRSQQQQTAVYVRDSSGRPLPSDEATELLDTIRLQLI